MTGAVKHLSEDYNLDTEQVNAAAYKNGQWGQCLELVKHLCQYSENVLVVTGKDGMGKTTLKNTLKHSVEKNFKFLDMQASSVLSVNKLMQSIAYGFGISFDSQASALNNKNQIWALLIDDAQELTLEVLEALFQLRSSAKGLLHIVLFAQPSLEYKVLASSLREEFETYVHVIELEPLSLVETEFLLQHQWRLAGNRTNLPFDRASINNIHSLSGGIISEVLKLAKSQINGEEVVHKTFFSTFIGVLSPVMLGLTLLFGVVFVLISFFLPADEAKVIEDAAQVQLQEAVALETSQAVEVANLATDVATEVEPIVELVEQAALDAMSSSNLEPQELVVEIVAAAVEETRALEQKNHELESKILTMQQSVEAVKNLPVAKETAVEAIPTITNKTLSFSKNEQGILSAPKDSFTIQLLGAAQEKRIIEFITQNKLGDKAKYYRTTHSGKPWYILIYGNYTSRIEANSAVKNLPEGVQSLKPWTRDIASIQKVIKKES
jgi:DamX protein